MSEPLINEWLSDWALLDSAELHSFAAEHDQNHEVEQTIYAVLEDRIRYSQVYIEYVFVFRDLYKTCVVKVTFNVLVDHYVCNYSL